MKGSDELTKKSQCTEDNFGKPFLIGDDKLEVNFDTVENVKQVEIEFKSGDGHIAELMINDISLKRNYD